MIDWPIYARINGPIVMIGFGSIGRGTLPLILRHFACDPAQVTVINPRDDNKKLIEDAGARFVKAAITRENHRELLLPLLQPVGGQPFMVSYNFV